jgi:hypothetical protein
MIQFPSISRAILNPAFSKGRCRVLRVYALLREVGPQLQVSGH